MKRKVSNTNELDCKNDANSVLNWEPFIDKTNPNPPSDDDDDNQ